MICGVATKLYQGPISTEPWNTLGSTGFFWLKILSKEHEDSSKWIWWDILWIVLFVKRLNYAHQLKSFTSQRFFLMGAFQISKRLCRLVPKKNMFLGNVFVNDTENIRPRESNGKMTFLFVEIWYPRTKARFFPVQNVEKQKTPCLYLT